MSLHQVKQFKELIEPVLLNDGKEYISANVCNLTSKGDNYISLMLSIDITTRKNHQSNEIEKIHAVAKLFPPSGIQQVFNTPVIFRNELEFYRIIAPAIKEFQALQGWTKTFDAYPDFIAGRLNLDNRPSNVADEDTVLILENIRLKGYENVEKFLGFDLATSKLALEKMAEFHATSFAMKTLNPEMFDKKIQSFIHEYSMLTPIIVNESNMAQEFVQNLMKAIKEDDELVQVYTKLASKVGQTLLVKNCKDRSLGKFVTLIHGDMWINNIMVKFDDNNTPIDVKFVDFQLYENQSVVSDLLRFIGTSVQMTVLKKHLDYLVRFYYDHFISYLKLLNYCEDLSDLTFENFLDELALKLKQSEIFIILHMQSVLYAEEEDLKELADCTLEDFRDKKDIVNNQQKEKSCLLMKLFLQRNWL